MKIIDCEPQWWFLAEEGNSLFLDANCNHSFVGYSFMVELNENELAVYRKQGRAYLSWLAQDIQNSAPILKVSNSIYKGRDVSNLYSAELAAAVKDWHSLKPSQFSEKTVSLFSRATNERKKKPFPDVDYRNDSHSIVKEFFNYLFQQGALLKALDCITQRQSYGYNEEFCFFPDLDDPDPVYHFEGVLFGAGPEEVNITEKQCWEYVIVAANHLMMLNPGDGTAVNTMLARIRI